MGLRLLILLSILLPYTTASQETPAIHALNNNIQQAKNDAEKIKALGELADYYYAFRLENKADSLQQQQLLIAQLSDNRNLTLQALFDNSITSIPVWSNKETFDRALAFLNRGLNYAKEQKKYDYEALAYIRKSSIYRKRGQIDNALEEVTHAFSALDNTINDSLRAILYIELGDVMLAKDEAVSAYKNYNKAYDIAYAIKNDILLSHVYHQIANLYNKLTDKNDPDETRMLVENYLLKSVEINRKNKNKDGLLHDYINLSRFMEKKEYIDMVLSLSNELKAYRQHLFGKQLMHAYLMVIEKNSTAALNYLENNEDLKQMYLNRGLFNYQIVIGHCYRYAEKPDSALKYYLAAEKDFNNKFEINSRITQTKQIAYCYQSLGQSAQAINYYEKALQLNKDLNSLTTDSSIYRNLSLLYNETGDYKKAYDYNLLYQNSKEQLDNLSDARQVVLMEVDRENRKHEVDLAEAERNKIKRQNLQYMGISIAIITLFMVLILFGMFPVSKIMIRMLGFIAFICLFEFVILLIDSYVHHLFHGDALYIWLFKIVVLAVLFPSHHYLEHAMVKFLESKRLMKLRKQLSIKQVWNKMHKPAPETEADVKEDTLVI